jgi:hypothetical protein
VFLISLVTLFWPNKLFNWSVITNIRCVCRGELSKSKQHAADLDKQLADAKATIEKCLKDYDTLLAKTQKVVCDLYCKWLPHCYVISISLWKQVTDDLESQVKQNKKMLESQQAMEKDLGLKRIEVSRLNTDNGLLQKKVHHIDFRWSLKML